MNSTRGHKEALQSNYFCSRMEKSKQVETIWVNHSEYEL